MEAKTTEPKLVFVYNADSGLFNTMTDIAHKIFSPSTYNCQLCALTHSYFSAKDEWKDFLNTIDMPLVFLHKDEYLEQYKKQQDINFPAILMQEQDELVLLIDADALNQCNSLDELKTLIIETCASVQTHDDAIQQ